MFGSYILNAAIGLVFEYVLLSLLISIISAQVIAGFFALRAKTIKAGIKNMLFREDNLVKEFYEHPMIMGLSEPTATGKLRLPSYIPADIFAAAFLGMAETQLEDSGAKNSLALQSILRIKKVNKDDPAKVLASIERWYNDTMDQVAFWYRRRLQLITFYVALVIVIFLNLDTLAIISTLSSNTAHNQVLGWSISTLPADFWSWVLKIVGLLATTFAVSLGAPFWFNVLYKIIPLK